MDHYPTAVHYVRKLRGGSQAHLIRADDGHFYAMKSVGNPQGTRVLVNEYLGSKIFSKMGIATAMAAPIVVTEHFLNSNPEMGFILGSRRIALALYPAAGSLPGHSGVSRRKQGIFLYPASAGSELSGTGTVCP